MSFELSDYEKQKQIINQLIILSKKDNIENSIEKRFIMDIAKSIGLSSMDVNIIYQEVGNVELHPPIQEKDRMIILYHLLFFMKIDGKMHENEQKMVYETGLRLGFRHDLIAELIETMKDNIRKAIPPDALIENIRKYHN